MSYIEPVIWAFVAASFLYLRPKGFREPITRFFGRLFRLCGSMFGLGVNVADGWRQLRRHRWFEATFRPLIPRCHHRGSTIGFYGDHARDRRRKPGVRDRGVDFADSDKLQLGRDAMDMPWADWRGISQAIPPAYSEFIANQFLQGIRLDAAAGKAVAGWSPIEKGNE